MIAVCLSVQSKSSLKLLFFITFLLDRELKWQPLPPEYDKYIAHIFCNDRKEIFSQIHMCHFFCMRCMQRNRHHGYSVPGSNVEGSLVSFTKCSSRVSNLMPNRLLHDSFIPTTIDEIGHVGGWTSLDDAHA